MFGGIQKSSMDHFPPNNEETYTVNPVQSAPVNSYAFVVLAYSKLDSRLKCSPNLYACRKIKGKCLYIFGSN